MKQFEAFLGTEFKAWAASETVKIEKLTKQVCVTQTLPDGRKAQTFFNLANLPAYAIVD
jgi:hypothetical protein